MSRTQSHKSRRTISRPRPKPSRFVHPPVKAEVAVDQNGNKWVRVWLGGRTAYAPLEKLITDQKHFWADLYKRGLIIAAASTRHAIVSQIQNSTNVEQVYAVDRTGWHGHAYVRGEQDIPDKLELKPVVGALPASVRQWSTAGSFLDWKTEVRRLCSDQPLAIFALGCAFASMLLPFATRIMDNPGFELVGPSSRGKSTLAKVSVAIFGSKKDWWRSWQTTLNALEEPMSASCDAILVLDELNHALGAKNVPIDEVEKAVFKLAEGADKARLGAGVPRSSRFIFLSTSNQPIRDLLARTAAERAQAVGVRMSTVTVDREFGCFDSLPAGCADSAKAIDQLQSLAMTHYGWAGNAFLARLQQLSQSRPDLLETRIKRRMDDFNRRAGVDPNNGEASRVADKFALVYAAASLAVRWKILPLDSIGPGILAIHRESTNGDRAAYQPSHVVSSAIDRIRNYVKANSGGIVDLAGGPVDMTITELNTCPGFRCSKWGGNWVLFRKDAFEKAFGADSSNLLKELRDARLLQHDRDGLQTQIKIRNSAPKDRVYCVRLAP
ncbi:DUF927 domain-containing protein [Mesorhizobium sp. L103C119B0]|uniref:DUF927 domain-containing protein n=1 Tax=Mesorhizobium sp. L103C119B0 TaxID=1287085 RepID=UPI000423816B|nr:DUF927 domain-containing protein [Mesorhizobium sp. L103C119B0]